MGGEGFQSTPTVCLIILGFLPARQVSRSAAAYSEREEEKKVKKKKQE